MTGDLNVEYINSLIDQEQYIQFEDTTLTICCLTLKNRATVTGQSEVVNFKDFDPVKGKEMARRDAINNLFSYEGYAIKTRGTLQSSL